LATTVNDAHGNVRFWEKPVVPADFIESKCITCHQTKVVPGAPVVSLGEKLFREKMCMSCHTLDGKGGSIGPELTKVGFKAINNEIWLQSHYNRMRKADGKKPFRLMDIKKMTAQQRFKMSATWFFKHFKDPQKYGLPGAGGVPSVMPNFGFTDKQAHALTVFVMGLTPDRHDVPAKYLITDSSKAKVASAQ